MHSTNSFAREQLTPLREAFSVTDQFEEMSLPFWQFDLRVASVTVELFYTLCVGVHEQPVGDAEFSRATQTGRNYICIKYTSKAE